jgi:hypothetical protein
VKTALLQLGRGGDVLNCVPLLWRDHQQTGERSTVIVSEPYASLFDGISYAECVTVPNKFSDIAGAWPKAEEIAKERGARLICTQIYGDTLICAEECSSFMRESWARVPNSPPWGSLPLVFDRRDAKREAMVRGNLLQNARPGKPYIVICLSGTSSPFAHNRTLANLLRRELRADFDVVDVSAFIAPRFFDLLGVMEGAHCIVTIDTGLLHLAHACPQVPVVALITREPSAWHGSPWRPSHVARFYYDEMPEGFGDVVRAVRLSR